MWTRRALLAAGGMAAASGAPAQPPLSEAAPTQATGFRLVPLLENLARPWSLAFLPGGGMLFTERRGQLRLVRDGQLDPRPVEGVPAVWIAGSAQHLAGMADLALHPDFARNRTIFLSYAHGAPEANRTRLARAVLDLDGHRLRDLRVIFEAHPEKVSYGAFGSRIAFLPDGTLLLAVGDGGDQPLGPDGRMLREPAQDLSTHLGKILRLHQDGTAPRDNPFAGRADALPEIYALGSRNSQGLCWDPLRRAAWFTDHGAARGDELNRLEPGRNYGWPVVTHSAQYETNARIGIGTAAPGMADPALVWMAPHAPSGLLAYTGDRFPAWHGDLLSGGLMSQDVRRIRLDRGGRVVGEESIRVGDRVRDIRLGPDGHLYLLTDRSARGRLLRLEPAQS